MNITSLNPQIYVVTLVKLDVTLVTHLSKTFSYW